MERNLLSARSCDRSQFLGWIGSSEFKVAGPLGGAVTVKKISLRHFDSRVDP